MRALFLVGPAEGFRSDHLRERTGPDVVHYLVEQNGTASGSKPVQRFHFVPLGRFVTPQSHTPYLPPQLLDARASGTQGPFSSDGVESLLTAAGFTQARTVVETVSAVFSSPEQWRDWTWSHGQRVFWETVPEEHRDNVYQAAIPLLEAARAADGTIRFTQQVRYTLGRSKITS